MTRRARGLALLLTAGATASSCATATQRDARDPIDVSAPASTAARPASTAPEEWLREAPTLRAFHRIEGSIRSHTIAWIELDGRRVKGYMVEASDRDEAEVDAHCRALAERAGLRRKKERYERADESAFVVCHGTKIMVSIVVPDLDWRALAEPPVAAPAGLMRVIDTLPDNASNWSVFVVFEGDQRRLAVDAALLHEDVVSRAADRAGWSKDPDGTRHLPPSARWESELVVAGDALMVTMRTPEARVEDR